MGEFGLLSANLVRLGPIWDECGQVRSILAYFEAPLTAFWRCRPVFRPMSTIVCQALLDLAPASCRTDIFCLVTIYVAASRLRVLLVTILVGAARGSSGVGSPSARAGRLQLRVGADRASQRWAEVGAGRRLGGESACGRRPAATLHATWVIVSARAGSRACGRVGVRSDRVVSPRRVAKTLERRKVAPRRGNANPALSASRTFLDAWEINQAGPKLPHSALAVARLLREGVRARSGHA